MDKYTKQDFNIGGAPTPFGGGVDTVRRKAQLPPGGYSDIKNMRGWHPGLESRAGYIKGHSNPIATESLGTWANRIEIIIQQAWVDSNLSDFPVMIKISASSGDSGVDITDVFTELGSNANRFKIAVTENDGVTQIPVEIELWDHAGSEAWLHVKVPFITSSSNTSIYLYYDSAQSDNTEFVGDTGDAIAQTVWDENFMLVYHLGQDPSGGADSIINSTSHGSDGTPGGTMLTGDLVDVVVGEGLEFDGVDDTVDFGSSVYINEIEELTVEAIINPTGWGSNSAGRIVSKINDDRTSGWEFFVDSTTDRLSFSAKRSGTDGDWGKDSVLSLATDAYVAVSYDNRQASNDPILYVDGADISAVETSTPAGGIQSDNDYSLRIASGDPSDTTDNFFDGKMDEVRVSNTIRSAAWIKATNHSLVDDLVLYAPGYVSGFSNRFKLVIDSSKIDDDLTSFPVTIHLEALSGIDNFDATAIFTELGASSLKIAVTTEDGITQCYVEVDNWDNGNNRATLHTRVPFISSTLDTVLYLYYDSGASDNTSWVGATKSTPGKLVWVSSFVGVYHLAQDPFGGSTDDTFDSSQHGNHGRPFFFDASGDFVDTICGKGYAPDANGEYVDCDNDPDFNNNLQQTLEVLVNPLSYGEGSVGRLISKASIGGNEGWGLWFQSTSSRVRYERIWTTGGDWYVNNYVTLSEWHYVAVTEDASDSGNQPTFYQDGEVASHTVATAPSGSVPSDSARNVNLMTASGSTGDADATFAEIRISDIERTAEWIKATSHSLYDTLLTFEAAETEETLPLGNVGPVKNIYHWSKDRRDEKRLYVQVDGALLYETDFTPPAVGTDFGTVVFTGTDPDDIASFANIRDILLYSNFADQHQIYSGDRYPVGTFIFCQDDAPFFPSESQDFSDILSNLDPNTSAALDGLTGAAAEAWFIRLDTMPTALHWEIAVANGNGSADFDIRFWDGTANAWDTMAFTDNTTLLTVDGTWDITPTIATRLAAGEAPRYMFGEFGFWYRIKNTGTGDLTNLEISKVSHNSVFQDIHNLWDGIEIDVVEVHHYDDDLDVYYTFPASTINLSNFHDDDVLYASCQDRAQGLYMDFGATPDLNGFVATPVVSYWDGSAWTSQTIQVDGTNNMTESGWLFWGRTPADDSKQQFRNTKYYAHWYRITWTIEDTAVPDEMSDSVNLGMTFMPDYDINTFGTIGNSNCSWKERACYTFKKFPRDIYVASRATPMVLNGSDFAILEPGDGRMNRVVSMKPFYNELMVWQKEEGKEGGCTTLFEGFNPTTYGKLILSTQIGSFSDKSTVVVDGSIQTTRRDDLVQTTAFWISHYGVYVTDGRIVTAISDDIQNYFDPRFDECIRQGFEDRMWIAYDSTALVLRLGLVSGSSATDCNIFPIYDLVTGTWSFDEYHDSISCMSDVEADSGQFFALQYAGGSSGAFIYRHNVGVNDDHRAIDSFARLEFSSPYMMAMNEFSFRMKIQSAGSCTLTVYENDQVIETRDLLMTVAAGDQAFPFAEVGDQMIRHREQLDDDQSSHISIQLQNDEIDERLYLFDYITDLTAARDR